MIPGHAKPLDPSHCAYCALYHSNPRYRALVDGAAPAPAPASPCIFDDGKVPIAIVMRHNLDVRREWNRCRKQLGDVPGIVCKCKECGPRCDEYISENELEVDF